MEGIHVGFDRRICTDASSKPLPITTVLSAVFSSPWHKSDGQNCVAPAMERFSSEFWCGGRRNTRVFQGRQAGNHRKSPMSGGTDPFHVCPCFLFVLLFRSQGAFSRGRKRIIIKKCAALLKRKRIIIEITHFIFRRKIYDGKQTNTNDTSKQPPCAALCRP